MQHPDRIRRWLVALCGCVAIGTLFVPFYSVQTEENVSLTIGGPAYWQWITGVDAYPGEMANRLVRQTDGADTVFWVLTAIYLLAGPLLVAYFGVRYIIAALAGGYSFLNAVSALAVYLAVGWLGLAFMSARADLPLELFTIADIGFWIGSIALIAGALVRRFVHE